MPKRFSTTGTLVIGILIGILLCGTAFAAMSVIPTTSKVTVDGAEVSVEAYNIDGYNYFKLRDFCSAIDIGVWYDQPGDTVNILTDLSYDPDYTGPGATTPSPQPTATVAPSPQPTQTGTNAPPAAGTTVYRAGSGKFYHSTSTCSNMKTPVSMTIEQALEAGLDPCSKCWSGVN